MSRRALWRVPNAEWSSCTFATVEARTVARIYYPRHQIAPTGRELVSRPVGVSFSYLTLRPNARCRAARSIRSAAAKRSTSPLASVSTDRRSGFASWVVGRPVCSQDGGGRRLSGWFLGRGTALLVPGTQSCLREIQRSGLMRAATYIGHTIAPRHQKLTTSPSATSKDRSGLKWRCEPSCNV